MQHVLSLAFLLHRYSTRPNSAKLSCPVELSCAEFLKWSDSVMRLEALLDLKIAGFLLKSWSSEHARNFSMASWVGRCDDARKLQSTSRDPVLRQCANSIFLFCYCMTFINKLVYWWLADRFVATVVLLKLSTVQFVRKQLSSLMQRLDKLSTSGVTICKFHCYSASAGAGCLTLLEILEILEIYWNNFSSWKSTGN